MPYARIERALDAARPGDVIEVYPLPRGRAYEAVGVLVDKPRVTIRAAGLEGTGTAELMSTIIPLLVIGLIGLPIGVRAFLLAENYAKRNGKLKRVG